MKLINVLHRLKTQFLTKLPSNELYRHSIISIGFLIILSSIIWVSGPYLQWGNYAPLSNPDKRLYVIIFMFLIWLLKFLLIDLDAPNPFQFNDPQTQKKLKQLQNRFHGVLQFLKNTTVSKQGKLIHLNELPWHLLIGPTNAGKTSLLANSNVNFILQKRVQDQDNPASHHQQNDSSEHCDWWITRDASIIDVPGNYISLQQFIKEQQKNHAYPVLWRFFLQLIKNQRGKNALNSIVIALPLPEIMKQGDPKKFHVLIRDIIQRLYELKKIFPHPIPCQFVITKCDLLPGFAEYFCEAGNDEIVQSWGITLPSLKSNEKLHEIFAERYDALIKRLNEQLIWRLHQERNPMARPYIKDFPLQIERMKEYILEFVKKFASSHLEFTLQNIYLTSALQNNAQQEPTILEDINNTQRAVQIFKEPLPTSRAYFIKQLITHGLINTSATTSTIQTFHMKRNLALTASISIIVFAAIILGKDFEQGIKQSYAIQNELSRYQLATQQFHDADEHLMTTLKLLTKLKQTAKDKEFKWDISYLLSFYSYKAQQKANTVYLQSLQFIFLPEIKYYLQDYLKNPINKNTDTVYAVLKTYLMLGDVTHFQPEFIINTIQQILPKSMQKEDIANLITHLTKALSMQMVNPALDVNTIEQTRKFLTGIPSLKLSYIILKNNNNNNIEGEVDLGTNQPNSIFVAKHLASEIPYMFTVKAFSSIFNHESVAAAQEALTGNWVLGTIQNGDKRSDVITSLAEQLRIVYVNNYIDVWESILANISLLDPKNLAQADAQIVDLISGTSPMLQLLQTIHDNTYFEPIISASPKLQSLGSLIDKNSTADNQMYQIFISLQLLHQYIQPVLTASNEKKAAFDIISNRIKNQGTPDAITQLRLIAVKSPEPVKNWLDKIANHTWYFLMQEAGRYLDTSWQENVVKVYQAEIANRYPFGTHTEHDVDLQKFINFFGNPGVVVNFYNTYLQSLVDTSTSEWHWKEIDNTRLPFSDETLGQIQQAMRIHRSFFPNGDNKLYVQFTLQHYKTDKNIKSIKLSVNNKSILDEMTNPKMPHVLIWPSNGHPKVTSLQLISANEKPINKHFSGDWGWFKLINQSYENAISTKELLVNFSMTDQSAKYVLLTGGQLNPFLSLNLKHFQLSDQLFDSQKHSSLGETNHA